MLLFLIGGCNPSKFALQKNTGWPIEGKIINNHHNVEVGNDRLLAVHDSARIAIRCEQITDGVFDTELKLGKNDRVTFQFRTTPYDDTVLSDRGILLTIEPNLTTIITQSDTVYKAISIPQGEQFRIVVTQHGKYVDAEVACTKVDRIRSDSPATQWVIINVDTDGTLDLIDPRFKPLADSE